MIRRRYLNEPLKFNQICDKGNFDSTSGWVSTYGTFSVANNIGTFTLNSKQGYSRIRRYMISKTTYHTYYGRFNLLSVKDTVGQLQIGGVYTNLISVSANVNTIVSGIATANGDSNNFALLCNRGQGLGAGDSVEYTNAMCIDLTAMYGAGNEPTTIEQVEIDCANIGHDLSTYQPYTPIQ